MLQLTSPKFQAFDSNGGFLVGGKLYVYAAGSSTEAKTYSNKELTAENTNPIILDSRGECVIYGYGPFKFYLADANDALVWEVDYVYGSSASESDITPESFGAEGDGTTDDTAAIMAAVAEALSTKRTLRFGPKTYLTEKWDSIDEGIYITGAEDGSTMLLFDVDNEDCITFGPTTDYYADKILFANLRLHTVNHVPANMITLGGSVSSDPQIFDAVIRNISMGYDDHSDTYPYCTGAFINSKATSYGLIDRCRIDQAYIGQGIRTQHSQDYTPATIGLTIRDTKLSNLLTTGGYDGIGLQVDGCQGLWCYDLIVQGCRGGGVKATQTSSPIQLVWNFFINGAHFENNTNYDLDFSADSDSYLTAFSLKNGQFFNSTGHSVINLEDGYGKYIFEDCAFNDEVDINNNSFNLITKNCQGTINLTAGRENYYTDENRRLAIWAKTDAGSDILTAFQYGGTGVKLFNVTDKGGLGLLATNGPVGSGTLSNGGGTTTVVNNSIVTANSMIYIFPTSANAAAAVGAAAGVYVSSKSAGTSFTLTHPASPGASATFDYLIIN